MQDTSIKEDHYEDLIFTYRNGRALEIYNYGFNIYDVTTGVDNNYNIIIVTTQPMKTAIITNNTEQPMKMSQVATQPTKTAPAIPPHPLPTILQIITNKLQWITTL